MNTTNHSIDANSPVSTDEEAVWHYQGYKLHMSEFTTAMVHLYRAEIQRANVWRSRLDSTTNWAVVASGAAVSFVLSGSANHFSVIPLNIILVTIFWWIEARRYRYYELWSLRVRLIETEFFARMLVEPHTPHPGWGQELAETLLDPQFPISMFEAMGRRLRRNYYWIYMVLGFAWILKGYLHPVPSVNWDDFIQRSSVGIFSGELVMGIFGAFFAFLTLFALLTVGMRQSSGEVLTDNHLAEIFGRRRKEK